nr:protein NATD1-like [Lytechinus pictus]
MLAARNLCRLFSFQQVQLNITRSMASSQSKDLNVNHNCEEQEFYIELDPPDRAILDYDRLSDGSVDMHHTGVPTSYRGRGIAAILAKAAFSHFTSEGTKMMLTCTYLQKYYKEHPDASTPDLITLPS